MKRFRVLQGVFFCVFFLMAFISHQSVFAAGVIGGAEAGTYVSADVTEDRVDVVLSRVAEYGVGSTFITISIPTMSSIAGIEFSRPSDEKTLEAVTLGEPFLRPFILNGTVIGEDTDEYYYESGLIAPDTPDTEAFTLGGLKGFAGHTIVLKSYYYLWTFSSTFSPDDLYLIQEITLNISSDDVTDPTTGPEATVGPEGGTLTLDQLKVVFSPDALETDHDVKLSVLSSDANSLKVECSIDKSDEFGVPVQLKVALPSDFEISDEEGCAAYYLDEDGFLNELESQVVFENGKPYLVAETDHFSTFFFDYFRALPFDKMLDIPYYNQGSTEYCWAAGAQMLIETAKHDTIGSSKVFSTIGALGVDEYGLSYLSARLGSVGSYVGTKVGKAPMRAVYGWSNLSSVSSAIRRALAFRNAPVWMLMTHRSHAWVIRGYDGSTFYIFDPQSVGNFNKTMTWSEISANFGYLDKIVLMWIPDQTDSNRPLVTVNLPHGNYKESLHFEVPAQSGQQGDVITFKWDHAVSRGYSFYSTRKSESVEKIPSSVETIHIKDVQIANSSPRTRDMQVSAYVAGKGKTHFLDTVSVQLQPYEMKTVGWTVNASDIIKEENGSQYSVWIGVREGTRIEDEVYIQFEVEEEQEEPCLLPVQPGETRGAEMGMVLKPDAPCEEDIPDFYVEENTVLKLCLTLKEGQVIGRSSECYSMKQEASGTFDCDGNLELSFKLTQDFYLNTVFSYSGTATMRFETDSNGQSVLKGSVKGSYLYEGTGTTPLYCSTTFTAVIEER